LLIPNAAGLLKMTGAASPTRLRKLRRANVLSFINIVRGRIRKKEKWNGQKEKASRKTNWIWQPACAAQRDIQVICNREIFSRQVRAENETSKVYG
jgi:hypothetical protein